MSGSEGQDDYEESSSSEEGYACTQCGDPNHQCLEELPDGAFYDAYGATIVDPVPTNTNYNFCGGQPLGLADHKWPICPKHGPLLFLFQMTDQKEPLDPCIIQVFICGTWYRPPYSPVNSVSVDLGCYQGQYLSDHDCRVQFDVGSSKNFAYFTRRFFPRPGMIFLTRPSDRHVVRIADKKNVDVLPRETALQRCDQKFLAEYDREVIEREVQIPRKDLVWQKFKMPYTQEGLERVYPRWVKDPHNYLHFGKKSLGERKDEVDLVMHFDSIRDAQQEAESNFRGFALIHHTQGWYEQHAPPTDYGYVFLVQEAGYLNISVHGNPAGGIGIASDLSMHFVL